MASALAATDITFTLDGNYATSAGVYKPDGTLVATLWPKYAYPAGTHTVTWDDKDDSGVTQPAGNYHFKLLYHNVDYVWEGVVGNTSSSFTGYPWKSLHPPYGLASDGANLFVVMGYNEQQPPLMRFNAADAQTLTYRAPARLTAEFTHVATDGNRYYVANSGGGYSFGLNQSFILAYNVATNAPEVFAYGVTVCHQYQSNGEPYPAHLFPSVIDAEFGNANPASGLAVQKTGSVLAVAHETQNQIRLFNKTSGLQTGVITVTAPERLAFAANGDLWCITGTSVVRFSAATLGTTNTPVATIAGLTQPVALAAHPSDNNIVLVADGGASQQVKAFTSTGASHWTYGTAGGYLAEPSVSTSKFAFLENQSYITILQDGSFWISDGGNLRLLHFSAARAYLEQIMYLDGNNYVAAVNANNPTRVFGGRWLEFQVDYTKPLLPGDPTASGGNGSWRLVKNWGVTVPDAYKFIFGGLNTVVTLSNGRTYGEALNNVTGQRNIVELPSSGQLRFTGIEVPYSTTFYANGDLRYATTSGTVQTIYKQALTGFDASHNPVWADPVVVASSPATATDPQYWPGRFAGTAGPRYPISSSNVLAVLDHSAGAGANPGMHLGGMKLGASQWLWKASPAAASVDYTQPEQQDGTYCIGDGIHYGGNQVHVSDRNVVYGFHGEGYRGGQANQFMHFRDDGLFIGQFGVVNNPQILDARAGLAGNAFTSALMKVGRQTYFWHNDENNHGAVHRWRLDNVESIGESTGQGALGSSVTLVPSGLKAQYFNGLDFNTLIATRTDPNIDFVWVAGSPVTGVNTDQFSVRWTGLITPQYTETYTFHTSTDDGARLWINNQLVVDRWGNYAADGSGTISLVAGQSYDIKLEYRENAGDARAKLEWQSASQPRVVVPQTALKAVSSGLDGRYFNGLSFETLVTSRIDSNISFIWGSGSPATGVNTNQFSVRWTGLVTPQFTETYTFYTSTDDGARLWVNNQLVVDRWGNYAAEGSGTISLTAGQPYTLKLEYRENAGNARAKLDWQSASQPRVVVPQMALTTSP